jgi:hypothetical protein
MFRMTTITPPTAAPPARPGRLLVRLGIALAVLPIVAFLIQSMVLKIQRVPWYVPLLCTIGALCFVAAFAQRRSLGRVIGMALVGLLAAGQWYMFGVLMALPAYTGPVAVDKPFPVFQTTKSDGTAFTQADLRDQTTVLTFFRGRW